MGGSINLRVGKLNTDVPEYAELTWIKPVDCMSRQKVCFESVKPPVRTVIGGANNQDSIVAVDAIQFIEARGRK